MKIVKGNIIQFIREGRFDVSAHGLNCFCTQGAGLAFQMVNAFGTDTYEMEKLSDKGSIHKLGQVEGHMQYLEDHGDNNYKYTQYPDENSFWIKNQVMIYNCYTQYHYGSKNHKNYPFLDYDALALCMRKIASKSIGKRIGLPLIGGGLAGGDEHTIKSIMMKEFINHDLTLVLMKKKRF